MYLGSNNSRMWKSRQWFLNGDRWKQLGSYVQMGRALVTGVLEEGGLRWSKWRRGRKQFDEQNMGRVIDRGG